MKFIYRKGNTFQAVILIGSHYELIISSALRARESRNDPGIHSSGSMISHFPTSNGSSQSDDERVFTAEIQVFNSCCLGKGWTFAQLFSMESAMGNDNSIQSCPFIPASASHINDGILA